MDVFGRGVRALGVLMLASCCRVGAAEKPFTPDELKRELASQLENAGAGYEGRVVPPFAIVAGGSRELLDEAEQTVTWASSRLRRDFFLAEPGKVITIWVWGDEESYRRGASAVLGSLPRTPFGYFTPCGRALVVNAGYGWGTLVHEMVHTFMAADFPDAPVWMNEGLASLYEAPRESNDGVHLVGAINWRLPSLQRALEPGAKTPAPSFEETFAASRGDFDGPRGPLFYAVSRYLCFYLQERGLLVSFYRAFRGRARSDPMGAATLADATHTRDLSSPLLASTFRSEWEAFVRGLQLK